MQCGRHDHDAFDRQTKQECRYLVLTAGSPQIEGQSQHEWITQGTEAVKLAPQQWWRLCRRRRGGGQSLLLLL